MVSSPNDGGFAEQLAGIRQRLASLRDRIETQSGFDSDLQREIIDILATALGVLQSPEISELERLQTSFQQQQVLLREIHHRINNNLQIVTSLLDLQVMRTEDPDVQSLLRDNQSRIRSIALLHELLSQSANITVVYLGEYVRNLATVLVRTYVLDVNQITFRTEITANPALSSERAIPIGLILNELISNAFKHGLRDGSGEIAVGLRMTPDRQVVLSVSNTGSPLPLGFDPPVAQSLGFQVINSLVQQLEGQLDLDRGDRTTIQVRFAVSNSVE